MDTQYILWHLYVYIMAFICLFVGFIFFGVSIGISKVIEQNEHID